MVSQFSKIVEQARDSYAFGKTRSIDFRKKQLKGLLRMYSENEAAFIEALSKDLRKPRQESIILELHMLKDDIKYILDRIDDWIKPEILKNLQDSSSLVLAFSKLVLVDSSSVVFQYGSYSEATRIEQGEVAATLVTIFDKTVIYHDPYGVVLIMGAWNYPLQLPLLPVSGAIAAGNCVIIKPSELSPATAEVIATLIPKYLDQECYHVICGGIPETTELLKEKFDYIFYTGSTTVGKIVRDAANKHLTPTTLELGGKSPVYIDDTVDIDTAVKRIMWGKCINVGQTCVAPDYIISTKAVQDKFVTKAKEVLKEWYGDNPQESPDLCRIVNDRNFSRLIEYLKDGKAVIGGVYDSADKWIEPTVLVNVSPESKIMKEEIFGPILPMVTIDSAHDAIKFINSRPKPLAFYVFTNNKQLEELFMHEVSCGGSTINDVIFHLAIPGLPFGGVGASGMGAYHGKASFDTFTHNKSCLIRNYNKIADLIGSKRYPPYSEGKINFLKLMLKERSLPPMKYFYFAFAFALGAVSLYAAQQVSKNECQVWFVEKSQSVRQFLTFFKK